MVESKTSQTGGQSYSDTSLNKVSECSLTKLNMLVIGANPQRQCDQMALLLGQYLLSFNTTLSQVDKVLLEGPFKKRFLTKEYLKYLKRNEV